MAVTFELPVTNKQLLRREWADFDAVAKEAALVELYRQAKLTTAFGLNRFAVDELLKRHQVTEDLLSAEALSSQIATLRKLVEQ
jgi:hypothetical protein